MIWDERTDEQDVICRGPARDPHWFVKSLYGPSEHLNLLWKPFYAYRNITMPLWDEFQKIDFFMIFHENHDFQEFHALRSQNIELHKFVLKASKKVLEH